MKPLENVSALFEQLDQSKEDIDELYYLLKAESDVKEKADAEEFEFKEGRLKFENVSF